MKYRVLASPSFVYRSVLRQLLLFAVIMFLTVLFNWWKLVCIFALLPGLCQYIFCYNAFSITTIDENGLHTKHVDWRWEELTEYAVSPVRFIWCVRRYHSPFRSPKELTSIICFGPPFKGSFLRVSRKNRAFISLTAKNLKRMYLLSKGRSPAINELWHRYSETLHCDQIDV